MLFIWWKYSAHFQKCRKWGNTKSKVSPSSLSGLSLLTFRLTFLQRPFWRLGEFIDLFFLVMIIQIKHFWILIFIIYILPYYKFSTNVILMTAFHLVNQFFLFMELSYCLFIAAIPFYILPAVYKGSNCSASLPTLKILYTHTHRYTHRCVCVCVLYRYPNWYEMVLHALWSAVLSFWREPSKVPTGVSSNMLTVVTLQLSGSERATFKMTRSWVGEGVTNWNYCTTILLNCSDY